MKKAVLILTFIAFLLISFVSCNGDVDERLFGVATADEEISHDPVTGNVSATIKVSQRVNKELVVQSSVTDPDTKGLCTTITFPKDSLGTSSESAEEVVKITVYQVEEAQNYTVSSEDSNKFSAFSFEVLVNGIGVSSFNGKKVVVSTYVPTHLTGVTIEYSGDGDQPVFKSYDPETGKLEFETTHFSDFVLIADQNVFDKTNNRGYLLTKAEGEDAKFVVAPAKDAELILLDCSLSNEVDYEYVGSLSEYNYKWSVIHDCDGTDKHVEDNVNFDGGYGTRVEPYKVAAKDQLVKVGAFAEKNSVLSQHFILENDITVELADFVQMGAEGLWAPNVVDSERDGVKDKVLVRYLCDSSFDGNAKKIKISSGEDTDNKYFVFAEVVDDSRVYNLSVEADNVNAKAFGIVDWASDAVLKEIVLSGNIQWKYRNLGGFVNYPHRKLDLISCNNYAAITNNNPVDNSYCSVFLGTNSAGYYTSENDITFVFTDCNNYGSLTSGQAGMFMGNTRYATNANGDYTKLIITNCKNYGTVKATGVYAPSGSGEHFYNYITSDTWDKSYAWKVSFDGGNSFLTNATSDKWYSKTVQAQHILGESGVFENVDSDGTSIELNADKTFKVTKGTSAEASYYVVHVSGYSLANNGHSTMYDITEKITIDDAFANTSLKKYDFVDDEWIETHTEGTEGSVQMTNKEGVSKTYRTYTYDGTVYYVLPTGQKLYPCGAPGSTYSTSVCVVVYDSSGEIICSSINLD